MPADTDVLIDALAEQMSFYTRMAFYGHRGILNSRSQSAIEYDVVAVAETTPWGDLYEDPAPARLMRPDLGDRRCAEQKGERVVGPKRRKRELGGLKRGGHEMEHYLPNP